MSAPAVPQPTQVTLELTTLSAWGSVYKAPTPTILPLFFLILFITLKDGSSSTLQLKSTYS
jgi:hypothetical protein